MSIIITVAEWMGEKYPELFFRSADKSRVTIYPEILSKTDPECVFSQLYQNSSSDLIFNYTDFPEVNPLILIELGNYQYFGAWSDLFIRLVGTADLSIKDFDKSLKFLMMKDFRQDIIVKLIAYSDQNKEKVKDVFTITVTPNGYFHVDVYFHVDIKLIDTEITDDYTQSLKYCNDLNEFIEILRVIDFVTRGLPYKNFISVKSLLTSLEQIKIKNFNLYNFADQLKFLLID